MPLADTSAGVPHVVAHNDERHAINDLETAVNGLETSVDTKLDHVDDVAASETQVEWTLVGDGTSENGWPNRVIMAFDPQSGETVDVFSLNEYWELRCIPAKPSTVAVRIFTKQFGSSPAHNAGVPVFEVQNDRTNRDRMFAIHNDGSIEYNGATRAGVQMTDTFVRANPSVPVPSELPANTLVVTFDGSNPAVVQLWNGTALTP